MYMFLVFYGVLGRSFSSEARYQTLLACLRLSDDKMSCVEVAIGPFEI